MGRQESKYFNTARRMDEALLSLLLEKDFAYITVKELCARAGVNRSTFYLHYENTADLLAECIAMIEAQFLQDTAAETVDAPTIQTASRDELFFITDQWLLPYLAWIRENKHVYKAIHAQMGVFDGEGAYLNFFQTVFSPILSRFGVARAQHEYIMSFYRHGLVAVLMKWVKEDCAQSPEDIAEVIKLCVGWKNPTLTE